MRGVKNDATLSSSAFRGIYENKEEKAEHNVANSKTHAPDLILLENTEKLNNQYF